jgi:predicted ArsR family transcriptional regulator
MPERTGGKILLFLPMADVNDSRARVLASLRAAPDGLDVQTLADRLGLHPNTIRWHLGALEHEGTLASTATPGAGRGRPRIVYRLEPSAAGGTRDEYRLLATILSGCLAGEQGGPAAAERAGRSWGRYLVERPLPLARQSDVEATAQVSTLLAEQGFAPEAADDAIEMRRCPFHDLAETQPEIVCGVHKGLISGALEELGSELEVAALDVFVRPDLCVARLARRQGDRGSARIATRATRTKKTQAVAAPSA